MRACVWGSVLGQGSDKECKFAFSASIKPSAGRPPVHEDRSFDVLLWSLRAMAAGTHPDSGPFPDNMVDEGLAGKALTEHVWGGISLFTKSDAEA